MSDETNRAKRVELRANGNFQYRWTKDGMKADWGGAWVPEIRYAEILEMYDCAADTVKDLRAEIENLRESYGVA